jgi:ATP-dependent DNA helicase RecQ
LIWQALAESYISKTIEDFGSIKVTKLGYDFLEKPIKFTIFLKTNEVNGNEKNIGKKADNLLDKTLMLLLKDLRKKIATKHSVPPYVIFQDPSLDEMTLKYPTTLDELASIFGVGEGKSKKYGKEFAELISDYVAENNISRPDDFVIKSSGKNSSLKLFIIQSIDRKLLLDDLIESKSMEMMDFVSEMESIVYSGTKLDLNYCIEEYLDEDQQQEIYDYFIESESDDIDLAIEEFEGEYDEFELRLYRIKFLSDLAN